MNLTNWIKYCNEKTWKKGADIVNYYTPWIHNGDESKNCANCNVWTCNNFVDGCGISCGGTEQKPFWYYIPDPLEEPDEFEEFLTLIPKKNTQMTFNFNAE